MADTNPGGIVAQRRDDIVASIARTAPPISESARARLALLLKPAATR